MRYYNPYLLYIDLMEKSAATRPVFTRGAGGRPVTSPPRGVTPPPIQTRPAPPPPPPRSAPEPPPVQNPPKGRWMINDDGDLVNGYIRGNQFVHLNPFTLTPDATHVYNVPIFKGVGQSNPDFGRANSNQLELFATEEVANDLLKFYKTPAGQEYLAAKNLPAGKGVPETIAGWHKDAMTPAGATPIPTTPPTSQQGNTVPQDGSNWGTILKTTAGLGTGAGIIAYLYHLLSKWGTSDRYQNAADFDDLNQLDLNDTKYVPKWTN